MPPRRERHSALWRLFVTALCMSQVMTEAAPSYFPAPWTIALDLLHLMR